MASKPKSSPSLTVEFTNNSNYDASQITIGFFSGPGAPTVAIINKSDKSPIEPIENGSSCPQAGNWYSLSDLSAGVAVSTFSGRIYICYGAGWSPQKAGYEPAQTVADPNFYLRYDKMEITFTGSVYDVADLTSIDYWAIPMTLNVLKNGSVVASALGLKGNTTTQNIYSGLNALTTPPVSGLPGIPGTADGAPIPALVPGSYQQSGNGPAPGTTFARIIGPGSYASIYPQGIPVQPYDTMKPYLTWLNATFGPGTSTGSVPTLGDGVIATIQGEFAGVGVNPPPSGPASKQSYDLSATIDSGLNITLTGTLSSMSGTTSTICMVYQLDDILNPSGFYGGNTPFYLNGSSQSSPPLNDVYGWIGGDLFSGLNIGAIGSAYSLNGTMVGAMPSQQWFCLDPASFYSVLQPNATYYNQWAATLQPLSDAYSFAYTDRFQDVQVALNPADVDTLEIVLEDGCVTSC